MMPSENGKNGLPEEGRDLKSGRFVKGWKGGPGCPQGRSIAGWRSALAGAVSDADVSAVAHRLLEAAKKGESWAVHELLDRCLGKAHVEIELQGDMSQEREYTEAELAEGRRLARLRLEAGDVGEPLEVEEEAKAGVPVDSQRGSVSDGVLGDDGEGGSGGQGPVMVDCHDPLGRLHAEEKAAVVTFQGPQPTEAEIVEPGATSQASEGVGVMDGWCL